MQAPAPVPTQKREQEEWDIQTWLLGREDGAAHLHAATLFPVALSNAG